MKQIIKPFLIIIIIAMLIVAGYWYFLHQEYNPSTDDAYVQANVIDIAAQINGPVSAIYVQDHATVKRGQPLFDIDPRPFAIAVDQAQANLENVQQQIKAEQDYINSAQALLSERQAELVNAQKYAKRVNTLVQKSLLPASEGDDVVSRLKVAEAAVTAAQSQLAEAIAKLGQAGEANAQVQAAAASLAQAKLDLQYTHIVSPASGYIINFTLRPGSMVTTQNPLFSVVDDSMWWVNANFKETDLQRIRPGQSATVQVDMYPNHPLKAVVQSISSGSGAAFALLPAENATGNWVKVTQRIPVRVTILNSDPNYPLRVGASSTVTINTR